VPATLLAELETVDGLRYGDAEVKESELVKPVPEWLMEKTLSHLPRTVKAMVDLQVITGMRSTELCLMRGCDIDMKADPTGKTWDYTPSQHKNLHRGHKRTVILGPACQRIIKPFLKPDLTAFLFSPADAEQERREAASKERAKNGTPLSCGNVPGSNRRRAPKWKAGDRYDKNTYRLQDKVEHPTIYVVARSEERVGVLMMTQDGLPFAYMTNGWIGMFDRDEPGQLLVLEHCQPSFAVDVDRQNERINVDISFSTSAEEPKVMLDFPALLRAAVTKATTVSFNKARRTIEVRTPHAVTSVELTDVEKSPTFPIQTLIVSTSARDSVAIGPVSDGSKPPAKVLGVTKEAIAKLGIRTRAATKEDRPKFALMAPDDFPKSQQEESAAKLFLKLFVKESK
jgi:hypothetical protein